MNYFPPNGMMKMPRDHVLFQKPKNVKMNNDRPLIGYCNDVLSRDDVEWWTAETHVEIRDAVSEITVVEWRKITVGRGLRYPDDYRLNNLTGSTVIVRERHLKVFSLNSMHQLNGHGVVGRVR